MSECCKSCGSIDFKITIMDHGPHYSRIDCKDCGKFVKWGKKPIESNENNKYTGGHESMNKAVLIGRLTKDPELRYTANNTAVCGFNLAVDRRFKQENGPEADFIPIVAWQKTAEFCGKHFEKGMRIAVSGSIQTRTWDDDNGVKRYVTEVVADEVAFADGKKKDGQSAPPAQNQNANNQNNNPPTGQRGNQRPGGPFNQANYNAPGNPQGGGTPPWEGSQGDNSAASGGTFPWTPK